MPSTMSVRQTSRLTICAAVAATCVGCGLTRAAAPPAPSVTAPAATTTTTTSAPTTTTAVPAPGPQTVIIVPPAAPQVSTQYVPYPNYAPSSPYGSGSDADFLARLRARDIVTPGDALEITGGRNVCYNLRAGSTITPEANKLLGAPYYYKPSLAGYFAGEAVKVYCPEFSYQLK